jgi:glycosyltransferase involved in cell wall biosynthesis
MSTFPKVTVLVPSYNHGKFLKQRLESIFNQTHKSIELIVVDDGSSDDSGSIIRSFLSQHSFQYIRNSKNSGSPFAAWKKAVTIATGKYIWVCESDDYADPLFLEIAVAKMENQLGASLFYCDSWVNNDRGEKIGHTDDYFHEIWKESRWDQDFTSDGGQEMAKFQVLGQTVPNMSSALFSTEAFCQAYHSILKKFKLTGDWLFVGLAMRYGVVIYLKKTLNYFRKHENTARVRVNSARSQAEFILTKYILFLETKRPVSEFASVMSKDAVRFLFEPDDFRAVAMAMMKISLLHAVGCGVYLVVSLLTNRDYLKKFFVYRQSLKIRPECEASKH